MEPIHLRRILTLGLGPVSLAQASQISEKSYWGCLGSPRGERKIPCGEHQLPPTLC